MPVLRTKQSSHRSALRRSPLMDERRSPFLGPPMHRGDTAFIGTEIANHPTAAIGAEFVSTAPFMSSPFWPLRTLPYVQGSHLLRRNWS
jgi:hypothetical protein